MAKTTAPEAPVLSAADEARLALHNRYGTPLNRRMTRLAFAHVLGAPDDSFPMTDDGAAEFSRFNSHLQLLDYTYHVAWWEPEIRGLYAALSPKTMFMVVERMINHAEGKQGPEAIQAFQLLAGLLPILEEHGKDYSGVLEKHRVRQLERITQKINDGYVRASRIYGEDPAAAGRFL